MLVKKIFPILAILWYGFASVRAVSAAEAYTFVVPVVSTPPSSEQIEHPTGDPAVMTLGYDFTYHRPASNKVTVEVSRDQKMIYFGFLVEQKGAMSAEEETNGPGVLNDDSVAVFLFPEGTKGFQYSFYSNPRGARYQWSSENAAYSPQWSAVGHRTSGGYAVMMAIPIRAIRAGNSTAWKIQFMATDVTSGSQLIWAHDPKQTVASDPTFAGTLYGMPAHFADKMAGPKARFQPYVLGAGAPAWLGGSTSRVGLDLSIPIAATASFVGTIHPDYSNVEADQQTISPSAFQHQYYEVRPFFTQATAAFNAHSNCLGCPVTLYTPIIPEFREGYAVEGTQGPLTYNAFSAVGDGRIDEGEALNFQSINQDRIVNAFLQNVTANVPGIHDQTETLSAGYTNQHSHLFAYGNVGRDFGTLVVDPSLSGYSEVGAGYADSTKTAMVSFLNVGRDFAPLDGYVQQGDIRGYETYLARMWPFAQGNALKDISFSEYYGVFQNHENQPAQNNEAGELTFDFKDFLSLHAITGALHARTVDDEYLPFDSNGISLGYRQNTLTPSLVQYLGGPYYHGSLDSWSYSTTLPVARTVHLGIELDENFYAPSDASTEPSAKQWLERASIDWQFSRSSSFDLGVRRIIGRTIPNAYEPPDLPGTASYSNIIGYVYPNQYSLPFQYVNVTNLSAAFHLLLGRNEIYVVYGDPSGLATTPTLYLKWIRYIGADKGT